jgi:hypothetical protein
MESQMISRQWTGITRAGEAETYLRHLEEETFPRLATIPGFLRVSALRRDVEDGVEFRVASEWSSLEAIRQFAGSDEEVAVVPPFVQGLMVRYDARAVHYALAARRDADIADA